jgi:hypothetical protein
VGPGVDPQRLARLRADGVLGPPDQTARQQRPAQVATDATATGQESAMAQELHPPTTTVTLAEIPEDAHV